MCSGETRHFTNGRTKFVAVSSWSRPISLRLLRWFRRALLLELLEKFLVRMKLGSSLGRMSAALRKVFSAGGFVSRRKLRREDCRPECNKTKDLRPKLILSLQWFEAEQ
jgi:hypothetical protein